MMTFVIIGGIIAFLTVIMSYIELMPFLKAVHFIPSRTLLDKLAYPFAFIACLPKAWPAFFDFGLMALCGTIGMATGTTGAIITLILSFIVSVFIKVHRHCIASKWNNQEELA